MPRQGEVRRSTAPVLPDSRTTDIPTALDRITAAIRQLHAAVEALRTEVQQVRSMVTDHESIING